MRKKEKKLISIWKIIILLIILGIGFAFYKIAPDYINEEITDKINLIINNNNVTMSLKYELYINEKETVYLSKPDVSNFLDNYIYYDEDYNLIITAGDISSAAISLDENEMLVNNTVIKQISDTIIKKNDVLYIPISEIEEIYNIEVKYNKENNNVVITSLDRKLTKASLTKKVSVKSQNKILCKTIDKLNKDDEVVIISEKNSWTKILTNNGKVRICKI